MGPPALHNESLLGKLAPVDLPRLGPRVERRNPQSQRILEHRVGLERALLPRLHDQREVELPLGQHPQEFLLLAHAHADINWVDEVQFSAHFLHSFSQSEMGIMQEGATQDDPTMTRPNGSPTLLYAEATVDDTTPDGKMSVWGADARLDLDMAGYLYAGFSQIRARDALTVAPAIEVLHSFGGGEFTGGVVDNYLESPFCANHGYGDLHALIRTLNSFAPPDPPAG